MFKKRILCAKCRTYFIHFTRKQVDKKLYCDPCLNKTNTEKAKIRRLLRKQQK
jgi:formylmethanofuran dehydrogenase subunit E